MLVRRALLASFLALWLSACGSAGSSALDSGAAEDVAPAPDAAALDLVGPADVSAGADGAPPPDGGAPADVPAGADAGGPGPDVVDDPWVPPAVVPAREPTPLPVAEWLVGTLPAGDFDPVGAALDSGTFALPAAGTAADGVRWVGVAPGPGGAIGGFPQMLGYAAAAVTAPAGERVFARADRGFELYGGGVPQPADIYGSGRMRVPLVGVEGGSWVVLQAVGYRGAPAVELWSTPHELVVNPADATVPDLVVGDGGERWLGVAVLNLTDAPALDLHARVVGDDAFEPTVIRYPALPAGAVTQVGFRLVPRAPWDALPADGPATKTVTLQLDSPSLTGAYQAAIELAVVDGGGAYRQTFRSPGDRSVQYYGVLPPTDPQPGELYGLVLSVHGAGVEAIGQAQAYSKKSWAYIVAPTNRRPFGFDWEEWGRLNALEALDDALARFPIRDTRVYLTGHSMGGHGTWHIGVTSPGRFAVLGPSAGWASFYTYTGDAKPTGAFGRARAHSDTLQYLQNLAHRGVFIIHGSADDNVPVREGRAMHAALQDIVPEEDLFYYEHPGGGHWWDGDLADGADCVDLPLLFRFMNDRRLDPTELTFTFRTPSPSYSATHSYVTLRACADAWADCEVSSAPDGAGRVVLTTGNARGLVLDGSALAAKGIAEVVVDGTSHAVTPGPIPVGPQDGKRPGQYGPYNDVYRRPFCFVYGEQTPEYRRYAAYLTSYWSVTGNGHACAVPLGELTDELRARFQLVYLGVPRDSVPTDLPFDWDAAGVALDGATVAGGAALFVFPQGEHLSAALWAAAGSEYLLRWVVPFSSRSGLPDYLVWSSRGGHAAGFFTPEWTYEP
jgi:dienelactone hydrolase